MKAHSHNFSVSTVVADGLNMADGIAVDSIGRKVTIKLFTLSFIEHEYLFNKCVRTIKILVVS